MNTHYRYPQISDRQLDFIQLAVTVVLTVSAVVFTPSPWRYPLIVLVPVLVFATTFQIRRRYQPVTSYLVRNYFEGHERDALLRRHFDVALETYTVACKYCDWKTTDYRMRLVDAPKHLHDHHPTRDPRIPWWLRLRATTWLGRRVTLG